MDEYVSPRRFIEQTELYPNRKLYFILLVGLSGSAFFITVGVVFGVLSIWALAIPMIILGAAIFAATAVSALAVGPHIGLHKDFIIWRLIGTRYSFIRWEDVDTVEAGGPENRPTLILVNGKLMNGASATVRIKPKNYRRGDKLLDEIVRRHEWVHKRK